MPLPFFCHCRASFSDPIISFLLFFSLPLPSFFPLFLLPCQPSPFQKGCVTSTSDSRRLIRLIPLKKMYSPIVHGRVFFPGFPVPVFPRFPVPVFQGIPENWFSRFPGKSAGNPGNLILPNILAFKKKLNTMQIIYWVISLLLTLKFYVSDFLIFRHFSD
jgi:hypothetical protein